MSEVTSDAGRAAPLTAQELFDEVVAHMVAQGRPAMDAAGESCAYLNEDTGDRCAIGGLVPPGVLAGLLGRAGEIGLRLNGAGLVGLAGEAVTAEMTGSRSRRAGIVREFLCAAGIDPHSPALDLAVELQNAHDRAAWSERELGILKDDHGFLRLFLLMAVSAAVPFRIDASTAMAALAALPPLGGAADAR